MRRRRPDRGAGRLPHRRAGGVLADDLRLLRNHVGLPDLLAGRGVERDHAAAEGAARIVGARARDLFDRRHRHVQPAVGECRRTGDAGDGVIVDLRLPEQSRRVCASTAVGVGANVAEHRDRARRAVDREPRDADRRADVGPVVERGVVRHLEVEPRHRRRAHRVQREALRVPGVDQLVGRRCDVGEDAEPGVGIGALPGLRVRYGAARRPERAVTADHDVGAQPDLFPVPGERDRGLVGLEVVQSGVRDLVVHDLSALAGRRDQVLLHLRLPVDPHRAPGQVDEVDVVPLARPLQVDAAVLVALTLEPTGQPDLAQQVHRRLLEDAGPDP